MRSPGSRRFSIPLDGGASWRGRRVLGDHKTLRGFIAIVPATGAAFAALGAFRESLPPWLASGLWPLPGAELFILGAWAAFWFMAGELPNSFLKRRWGVAPGAVPPGGAKRALCLVIDRVDSIVVMLLALAAVVPLPGLTAVLVIVFGSAVHLAFSAVLWLVHVKERFA
jgi:CDP-2,3-bis-(O-geranylgeranyl)-sn-glycerol synthase